MHAFAWCIHVWVAWAFRHALVDPSSIVELCWGAFAA